MNMVSGKIIPLEDTETRFRRILPKSTGIYSSVRSPQFHPLCNTNVRINISLLLDQTGYVPILPPDHLEHVDGLHEILLEPSRIYSPF